MDKKIKALIKRNNTVLNLCSFFYTLINGSIPFSFQNRIICRGAFLKKTKFRIHGKNNSIFIERRARIADCSFEIYGDNNVISIGGNRTIIRHTSIHLADGNCNLKIGEGLTMEGGHIAVTEHGNISIGKDCMFSDKIEIRNGDSHSIIDINTDNRINHAKDVSIGNHVWLCASVKIMKGTFIPDNCIVGNDSLVTKRFDEANVIYAGNPAKVVKHNITWERNR